MDSIAMGAECLEAGHTPPGCRNSSAWREALCSCGDSWAMGGKLMGRTVLCPVVSEGLTMQSSMFHVQLICFMEGSRVSHASPLLAHHFETNLKDGEHPD